MRDLIWDANTFEIYCDWENKNPRIFNRISELIQDIRVSPYKGIGKPELLKYQYKGCWSRRITDKHRLIYRLSSNNEVHIISCKGHYD